jgi:hypothetical protein
MLSNILRHFPENHRPVLAADFRTSDIPPQALRGLLGEIQARNPSSLFN